MADKKPSGGGGGWVHSNFELAILLFIIVLFFVWLLTGGKTNESTEKPFIKPLNDKNAPGEVYGPEDTGSNWGTPN